jgi:hypothetical protein
MVENGVSYINIDMDRLRQSLSAENESKLETIKNEVLPKLEIESTISIDSIKTHADNYINRINDFHNGKIKVKLTWIKAGWHCVQMGAIKHIFKHGEKIICFACRQLYINPKDCENLRYMYIINSITIPKCMQGKFIRAFGVCSECATKTVYPPPSSWDEALTASLYLEGRVKVDLITSQIILDETVNYLENKFNNSQIKHDTLTAQNAELEKQIQYLETLVHDSSNIAKSRSDVLSVVIHQNTSILNSLKQQEQDIKNQIREIDSQIVNLQDELRVKIKSVSQMVEHTLEGIGDMVVSSGLSNMEYKSIDPNMCLICLENSINIVIVPCGHSVACESCLSKCPNTCPICRTQIQAKQKIYRS